jgi:hypothetical protein
MKIGQIDYYFYTIFGTLFVWLQQFRVTDVEDDYGTNPAEARVIVFLIYFNPIPFDCL